MKLIIVICYSMESLINKSLRSNDMRLLDEPKIKGTIYPIRNNTTVYCGKPWIFHGKCEFTAVTLNLPR